MKFEKNEEVKVTPIYHSRNLLMKFEFSVVLILLVIYHSRNLLMKFEEVGDIEYAISTTVEIY